MAMTIERLGELCKGEGVKYFLAPDKPMVMMAFGGINGSFQVVVPIELDGRFLQVRTIGYLHCPADHPHLSAVLAVLAELNYRLRMTKFGWDPVDGEIVGYADVWVEDGELTQNQFGTVLKSLVTAIDLNYKRFSETMETGEDPGEVRLADLAGDRLPPELRRLLDKIAGKEDPAGSEADDGADAPGDAKGKRDDEEFEKV